MSKLTNFSDFVGGNNQKYNKPPKPYIYVIEYILSKDNYIDELKDYITNYQDELYEYEDSKYFDPFISKLKYHIMNNEIEEIEDMVLNYKDFEDDPFDEDDEDIEEKMYKSEFEDTEKNDYLSEKLRNFLKIDITFEDIMSENEDRIDENSDEIKNIEIVEIKDDQNLDEEDDIEN